MNRLLTLVLISLSLTILHFGVSNSTNSSGDYSGSGEQPATPTSPDFTDLPHFTTSFPCPCSLYTVISILGYSPCSIHNYISPRECDAYVHVALLQGVFGVIKRVDLPFFNNYCFFLFPFNEAHVSSFNQT